MNGRRLQILRCAKPLWIAFDPRSPVPGGRWLWSSSMRNGRPSSSSATSRLDPAVSSRGVISAAA